MSHDPSPLRPPRSRSTPLKTGLLLAALAAGGAVGSPGAHGLDPQVSAPLLDTIRYRVEPVPDDPAGRYDPDAIALLEKLNRTDAERLPRLEAHVVPDVWDAAEAAYSPLPRGVPELRDEAKALVVHLPVQVFGAYEAGRLVRWGPVSTGRSDRPTPSGLHHLTWRSRGRHSTVNPEWYLEWYYNFHNERGLSFHQYELPGEPASHACIRLLERDARWIYEWGEPWTLDDRGWEVLRTGTPVWILGAYDFDAPPPWLDPDDPHPSVEVSLPEDAEGS